jgi:hypothetical protein
MGSQRPAKLSAENVDGVCLGSIVFTPIQVLHLEDGHIVKSIKKTSIQKITVKNGFQAPHPVVQVFMGLVVSLVGLFPVLHVAFILLFGGRFWGLEAFLAGALLLGPWLVYDACKRGYSLRVKFHRGSESWPFAGKPTPEEMTQFLSAVRQRYGYEVSES